MKTTQVGRLGTVYLCASMTRREEMRAVRRVLERRGFMVISSWLSATVTDAELSPSARVEAARGDLLELEQADLVIVFTTPAALAGYQSGGRHVELGYALARGKRIALVGPQENVFHALPVAARADTFAELLDVLEHDGGVLPAWWRDASGRVGEGAPVLAVLSALDAAAASGDEPGIC